MPTPEEVKEGVRMFQEELDKNADAIAAVIGTELKLGEPVWVETAYNYSFAVGGPVVTTERGDTYEVTDVVITVCDDDISATVRGTKMKKDGTPTTYRNMYVGDWETSERFVEAFKKTVGGGP